MGFLCKLEDLSLDLRPQVKKMGVASVGLNTSPGDVRGRRISEICWSQLIQVLCQILSQGNKAE